MKIVLFYHSLLSDWNHGNAHFLRGLVWELKERGHELKIFEPSNGWSLSHLLRDHGPNPVEEFYRRYPGLVSALYRPDMLDLDRELAGADMVIVHEWNEPGLIEAIGCHRRSGGQYRLFFHDTHHRAWSEAEKFTRLDLSGYDGVLAYGRALADIYLARGWVERAWVWHEAADTRVFQPLPGRKPEGDLVWIGNWGEGERAAELEEFLIEPVKRLGLRARVYGVRYPESALASLSRAGIEYGGWLPNYRVPEVFASYRTTVHIHRRPYVVALPGIPTIRPFEALACGIPLVCSPWQDCEHLFAPGDYLIAENGAEMARQLRMLLNDKDRARKIALQGRRTILDRHTCRRRVDELLQIFGNLKSCDTGPGRIEECQERRP